MSHGCSLEFLGTAAEEKRMGLIILLYIAGLTVAIRKERKRPDRDVRYLLLSWFGILICLTTLSIAYLWSREVMPIWEGM